MSFYTYCFYIILISPFTIAWDDAVKEETFLTPSTTSRVRFEYVTVQIENTQVPVSMILILTTSLVVNLIFVSIIAVFCYALRRFQPWRYITCRFIYRSIVEAIQMLLTSSSEGSVSERATFSERRTTDRDTCLIDLTRDSIPQSSASMV